MTIQSIKDALSQAKNPVAKAIHHNSHFKVLVIGFNQGMVMATHTAKWPSKLTVLEGIIHYTMEGAVTILNQYDEFDIPVGVVHSLEAKSDSLCLLTQSDQ